MPDPAIETVRFPSGSSELIGRLFLPPNAQPNAQRPPAAIVTGAWMTVKEQMPERYAREMAARGIAALTFDFTGWGESEGGRRQFEDPEAKIDDIRAAATFLTARDDVDPNAIGGLGVCASSGYMIHAATGTDAIRSVALVAPWLHDAGIVRDIYGGGRAVEGLLAKGDEAERLYEETGEQRFVPAASMDDERAIMFEAPYYTEPDRGMIPQWRNEADPAFWRGWLTFDAIEIADRFTKPFLMVESTAAAAPAGARAFYERLTANPHDAFAREVWIEGASQFDFYDRDGPVHRAANEVAQHFKDTLNVKC